MCISVHHCNQYLQILTVHFSSNWSLNFAIGDIALRTFPCTVDRLTKLNNDLIKCLKWDWQSVQQPCPHEHCGWVTFFTLDGMQSVVYGVLSLRVFFWQKLYLFHLTFSSEPTSPFMWARMPNLCFTLPIPLVKNTFSCLFLCDTNSQVKRTDTGAKSSHSSSANHTW